jgi:cyanophycinase-like exopeptidase
MGGARLLTIMGSGETSPTMVKVHRDLLERVGTPAVVIDTPVGFQENANEVTGRAVAYFNDTVGVDAGVASYRSAREADAVAYETVLARLREAHYVFAGPGSPSYALEQWQETLVPQILREKLRTGGCVTFASAAALTVGTHTVPVYEIYKVGEEPHWLEGLDLLAKAGLRAAVIPHYDNAEGGTHDTRFCYLGQRRLAIMEEQLPEDVFVLGVDEHTACIIDFVADTVSVAGLGAVTERRRGQSVRIEAGTTVSLEMWREGPQPGAAVITGRAPAEEGVFSVVGTAASPFLDGVEACEREFAEALASGDARAAVTAVLGLDDLMVEWGQETFGAGEPERARAALRSMVTRLGERADEGLRDPREALAPFVDALLETRHRARSEKRFADADAVRDRLLAAGVEIHDHPDGTTWNIGDLV